MRKLMLILVLVVGCQSQNARNSRKTMSKELNEYSYVVNSWYLENGKVVGFPSENIFMNDYLNSSGKDRPPKYLVYYFEDRKAKFAYKLKVTLNETMNPLVSLQKLESDELGCSKRQLANEDFRRQSCYFNRISPVLDNESYDLNLLYQFIEKEILKNYTN